MIPNKPQLPGAMFPDLSDFEKDFLAKLTKLLEQQAREINSKTANQYEDALYWMTRP